MKIKDLMEMPVIGTDYKQDKTGEKGSFFLDTNKVRSPKWRGSLIGRWKIKEDCFVHFLETDAKKYDNGQGADSPELTQKGLPSFKRRIGYSGSDVELLRKNFGYEPKESAINIVLAGNSATSQSDVKYKFAHMFTPWMVAHRWAHAAESSWAKVLRDSKGYEKLIEYHNEHPLFQLRGYHSIDVATDIFLEVGNVKSIRSNDIGTNPAEAFLEIFAAMVVLNRIPLHDETPDIVKMGFKEIENDLRAKWFPAQIGKTWVM